MEQYNVSGMSCAACSARVEKAVNKVPGVTSCSVSLLTNSMGVEGAASPKDVIKAVKAAGYGAKLQKGDNSSSDTSLEDNQTPMLIKRLAISLVFLLILMYVSMGHMMWGWPLPSWFNGNHVAMGIMQMLLAAIVMVINQRFFISGTKALVKGSPNMDTLVALGSFAAFAWSTVVLFLMTDATVKGDENAVMVYMDQFYFESAAMIVTLITIGKMLEARSKGKTTDAIKSLMKLSPKTATVIRDDEEVKIPATEVKIGDIFVVKPGDLVPVDGKIIEGYSSLNESALTGESIPVDKNVGDEVSQATINQQGYLKCQALRVGNDTTLSQIIKMVNDAQSTKAPIAKIADKVSGIFVPSVISIAIVTIIVWMILGKDFGYALARGISVLVISCPCALGLATPVAIMVGSGLGARHGILFKTAASLEVTGKVNTVVLDKTGTITNGTPKVIDVMTCNGMDRVELLQYAGSIEAMSEHPLSKAIVDKCDEEKIELLKVSDFEAFAGNGISGNVKEKRIVGGSLKFIKSMVDIDSEMISYIETYSGEGKTPLLFIKDNVLMGVIAVADTVKIQSKEAINHLKDMGIKVIMLTGDNERTAKAIGDIVGVDRVIADVLPDGKEAVIKELMNAGKVAMVGDGINDAPALTRADVGMAIGAGSDVAIDAADVVLVGNSIMDVVFAIRLGRATLKNIYENLFWAFIYNIIGIPLAAGVFVKLGLTLNPMFGALAMSLSSFCVVTNALRLNSKKSIFKS